MELAEALKEAKEQMSQAIYLCESSPGVYNTGLQSVYGKKSAMLSCLIYGIESLQAENEWLKANQPVRCGEVASHSEREIVEGCITLMQWLTNKFKEYIEFVDFEPECEEEKFCVGFHYSEIVKTLLLLGTSHSGGTSTAKKCKELGFDYSKMVEFDFEEDAE